MFNSNIKWGIKRNRCHQWVINYLYQLQIKSRDNVKKKKNRTFISIFKGHMNLAPNQSHDRVLENNKILLAHSFVSHLNMISFLVSQIDHTVDIQNNSLNFLVSISFTCALKLSMWPTRDSLLVIVVTLSHLKILHQTKIETEQRRKGWRWNS